MANPRRRLAGNVEGPWYVDDSCIDCDAARQIAPELFGEQNRKSVVIRQPQTPEEEIAAQRALLACPVAAIGVIGQQIDPTGLFPQPLGEEVYYCGYNSVDSFGANAFFLRRRSGNYLIDSPRFVTPLVRALKQLGGIQHVLLTHQDDIADAERYATHFGARVWIHEADAGAAPFATDLLRGNEPAPLAPDVLAIPVPGHTRGSTVYLFDDGVLLTGDSLAWDRRRQDLTAFRRACWYSWTEQRASLARLAAYAFCWVLAGHGDRHKATAEEMHARLLRLVERMADDRAWRS